MEGYLSILEYCRRTGISKDTAHHRAIRGTVEAFKNSHGRWFIYYNDENAPIPEGFVHISEYARSVGESLPNTRWAVMNNRFRPDDIFTCRRMTDSGAFIRQTFIRKNAKRFTIQKPKGRIKNLLQNRPEGYLTAIEAGERMGYSVSNVYHLIYIGMIEAKKVNNRWYISEKVVSEYGNRKKNKSHDD